MEVVYLLCSICYTFITSLALSLLLPFHSLLTRLHSSRTTASTSTHEAEEPFSLYEGTVWHERRRPVHHSFKYPVRYALFDLDHAPHAPPDHLSADTARQIAQTNGPVFLLTIPHSVGYEQNPLSLYYCYDMEGPIQHLNKCISEVTNTPWGERVTFVFDPNSDLVAKPLHVSPFMDMHGNWSIRANAPGENLFVSISVQHPKLGNYFTATLKAKKVSSSSVSDHALFFWLMPHKVAVWIYWHALKLWWKSVPFIQHPRYTIPAYKKDASMRDRKLQCCEAITGGKDRLQDEEIDMASRTGGDRCFAWRDAKWPWC
ncbi:DUF1365 domain-containing protein [Cephalotus follicularis]|uniref:DUF1365 domain-containing protein n=1 Tax=Cephalotus follicularis TaxID=3775 RepID=A0A1Q3D604_CEPFO|nr:DUF1365 domain-containing protein [Cephalotus follicularis]